MSFRGAVREFETPLSSEVDTFEMPPSRVLLAFIFPLRKTLKYIMKFDIRVISKDQKHSPGIGYDRLNCKD